MRTKLLITGISVLFSAALHAQQLNPFGHFVRQNHSPEYKITPSSSGDQIETAALTLEGSSLFETENGYITLSGKYENAPAHLRLYSNNGEELFSKEYRQAINFTLSANKKFVAFHDMSSIHVLNTESMESSSVKASNVFAVNDAGMLAYYDEANSTINFNGEAYPVSETIYRILFFKNAPLFVAKSDVLKHDGTIVFYADGGRIFDVAVFDEELYISTKRKHNNEFIFNSYSSSNLISFAEKEQVAYPLMQTKQKINSNAPLQNNHKRSGELIRDPLNFYSDTVYQPIGNSYAEIQEYGGDPYLHPGVDLLGDHLQEVHSVKKGYVKAILTTSGDYHWRIAIANKQSTDATQGYLYAHIDQATFLYAVGDTVEEGEVVGLLVDFPVAGFVHCHFARIVGEGNTWSGDWWTYDNPLNYMTNVADTTAPEFEKTRNNDLFAFRNSVGNYISPNSLSGQVKVISKFYDRMNSDWHIDVDRVQYSLSPLSTPAVRLLDTLAYEYNFYTDVYSISDYSTYVLNTIYSRDAVCFSTGNYDERSFFHIVTNSNGDDTITSGDRNQYFNTTDFADGSYIFRITVSDPAGNTTTDSMIIQIKNNTGIENNSYNNQFTIFPNPSHDGIFMIRTDRPVKYEVYDVLGKQIISGQTIFDPLIDLSSNADGIYTVRLYDEKESIREKLIIKN